MSPITEICAAGRNINFLMNHNDNSRIRIPEKRVQRTRQILQAITEDEQQQIDEGKHPQNVRGIAKVSFTGPFAHSEAYSGISQIHRDLKSVCRYDEKWKGTNFICERDWTNENPNREIIYISYK